MKKNKDLSETTALKAIRSKRRIKGFLIFINVIIILYIVLVLFGRYIPYLGDL